jgi:hypothetical protein
MILISLRAEVRPQCHTQVMAIIHAMTQDASLLTSQLLWDAFNQDKLVFQAKLEDQFTFDTLFESAGFQKMLTDLTPLVINDPLMDVYRIEEEMLIRV